MKKPINKFTPEEREAAFGKLSEEEIVDLEKAAVETEFDPAMERGVKDALDQIADDRANGVETPSIPAAVRAAMDKSREAAFSQLAKEETELESRMEQSVYGKAREEPKQSDNSWRQRFFRPGQVFGILGVAAAVVVIGLMLFQRSEIGGPAIASTTKLLTPGPVTGFTEPVFVWKTDQEKPVDIEIIEVKSGVAVAKASNAVSPVAFTDLEIANQLVPDGSYRVRISEGSTLLSEREFKTLPHAVLRGPKREIKIEGVIRQCKQFIASGRPADAWMLWSQLTEAEKNDSRMLELKKQILAKIG